VEYRIKEAAVAQGGKFSNKI